MEHSNEPALAIRDVTVRFRPMSERHPTFRKSVARRKILEQEVVALDGVSFDVRRGEAYGIIGQNGAGKSTLLRVLARTLRPNEGEVSVRGRTSSLLQLGVGFNAELSGRRNVFLGGLAHGLTVADVEKMFNDIVDYAELWDAIDRPLKTYSTGMFARLAFSVSMHLDPDILLLDEVLSVGDSGFQEKSIQAMNDLLSRSGTIVFVSHAMQSVREFCDRVLWLDQGKVRRIGPASGVVEEYVDWAHAHSRTGSETLRLGRPRPTRGRPKDGWSVDERLAAVLAVLAGEPIARVAQEYEVPDSRVAFWRDAFIAAGREGLRWDALEARRNTEEAATPAPQPR